MPVELSAAVDLKKLFKAIEQGKFMRRYLLALCMLACAGCAPPVVKIDAKDLARSDSLPVVDARPDSEKESKIFSLMISNKEYGIIRVGDGRLSPSPVRLVQHETFQKFAASGRRPALTVRHFVIYQNMRSQLRSSAIGTVIGGALGGIVGQMAASHDAPLHTTTIDEMSFSGSEEYLRGSYNAAENPDQASVWVIYIATDIDGKKTFTRTVASMKSHSDGSTFAGAVEQAVKDHLARYDMGAAAMAAATTVDQTSTASLATVAATRDAPAPVNADAALTAMAQGVANQMSCGTVRANGDASFLASCGAYDVAIDCGGGRCHPTHTVKAESL